MEQKKEFIFRGRSDGKWIEGDISRLFSKADISLWETDEKGRSAIHYYPVEPETVGQYIWRTDKNGKKVFDGDIIRYEDTDEEGNVYLDILVVRFAGDIQSRENDYKYVSGYCCQTVESAHSCIDMFSQNDFSKYITVIGNRFDNPELLEVRHGK